MTSPSPRAGMTPASATRSRRRGSDGVAEELLDAALVEFAARGFEGASTRAIAGRAGWHQPQINYYFSSKELLWKAAVDRLFAKLASDVGAGLAIDDRSPAPAALFAAMVRRFVRFSALHPELHRIMNLESTSDSDRLAWIVERHLRAIYARLDTAWRAVRATGAGAPIDTLEVYQLIIGFGALPFANAPMLARLTDVDLTDDDQITAHAERVVGLLFPTGRRAPRSR